MTGLIDGYEVRLATETDLGFVMALQRRNRESVGGLPEPAITERVRRGSLLLGLLNGDPCGYLLYDARGGILRVPQACIQFDARRRAYGEALVGAMLNLEPDVTEIRLRCAADLEANVFWSALGFTCVGTVKGGSRRGRLLNLWQKWNDTRLFPVTATAQAAAWQQREDCRDEETGFLTTGPAGFVDGGSLGKLAWSNRKPTPTPTRQKLDAPI